MRLNRLGFKAQLLEIFNKISFLLTLRELHLPHPDLQLIPEEDRLKWADALDTSVQHRGSMSNKQDTSHCCLAVAERELNGATFEDYGKHSMPYEMKKSCLRYGQRQHLGDIVASYTGSKSTSLCQHNFSYLNDAVLIHPQIAQLLRGQSVWSKYT